MRDHMTTDLVTFRPEQRIHDAIARLLERGISGAPVVDDAGRLVGVLSNKDCLRLAFEASYHQDWGGLVSDAMSSPVETVAPDQDIVQVADLFLHGSYRRYPVVEDGRLVGLVTRADVLRALEHLWSSDRGEAGRSRTASRDGA